MRSLLTAVCALIVLSCASTSNPPDNVLYDGKTIVAPVVIKRVEPDVPAALRTLGVSGTVIITGTVPKEGGVLRDPRVKESDDARLSPIALAAVSQWVWKPGTLDGQPVDAEFHVPITFGSRQ
jgi:protein TonB